MMRVKCFADISSDYIKAGSESSSPKLLSELAHSEVDRIRERVAENTFAPLEVLELLAEDKNPEVRRAAGTNTSTPMHVRYSLAFDEDPNVRFGLAEDMNTPLELLNKLTEDSNPYISCRAEETKKMILAREQPNTLEFHRFFKWATKFADPPEFQYA